MAAVTITIPDTASEARSAAQASPCLQGGAGQGQRGAACTPIPAGAEGAQSPADAVDTPIPAGEAGTPSPAGAVDTPIPSYTDMILRIHKMRSIGGRGAVTFRQKCRDFREQAEFMQDYVDDYPWRGDLTRYFATYRDLSDRQLRGYFTWRAAVRRGEFGPIPVSVAYIYIYEILCGVGVPDVLSRLEGLRAFEAGFVDGGYGDDHMRDNIHRWMRDLAVVYRVPPEEAARCLPMEYSARDAALSVLLHPERSDAAAIYGALRYFYGNKLDTSPVVRVFGQRGVALFAAVWRYTQETFSQGGRDFFGVCFGEQTPYPWHPLSNAVFWDGSLPREADYSLSECRRYVCRSGVWSEIRYEPLFFNKSLLRSFLREADRRLRIYLDAGHPLTRDPDVAWTEPYIDHVLEKDRRAVIEASLPRIDMSILGSIRTDAAGTRDSLLVEDEDGPAEAGVSEAVATAKTDVTLTSTVANATGSETPVDTEEATGSEAACAGAASPAEAVPTERTAAADPAGYTAVAAGDPPLTPVQMRLLRALLESGPDGYAPPADMGIPSVLADSLTDALLGIIGDVAVDCDGAGLYLIEDYREDIISILEGAK